MLFPTPTNSAEEPIVHQDRGSPPIARTFAELMTDLGLARSYLPTAREQ
jgi:hypothetical protein